jgi:hypothetical protein
LPTAVEMRFRQMDRLGRAFGVPGSYAWEFWGQSFRASRGAVSAAFLHLKGLNRLCLFPCTFKGSLSTAFSFVVLLLVPPPPSRRRNEGAK